MESVVMDKSGRMVLPKKVREEFDTNVFEIRVQKKAITLKPRKGLLGLFGKIPEVDAEGFYREKKEEAKREDTS